MLDSAKGFFISVSRMQGQSGLHKTIREHAKGRLKWLSAHPNDLTLKEAFDETELILLNFFYFEVWRARNNPDQCLKIVSEVLVTFEAIHRKLFRYRAEQEKAAKMNEEYHEWEKGQNNDNE